MAAQESVVPMDDAALMSAALANEPPAEAPPEPERQEPPRDELGRFAAKEPEPAKAEEPEAKAEPQPETPKAKTEEEPEGQIPPWRLREMREERDAERTNRQRIEQEAFTLRQQMTDMQRQLAQLQKPKAEPVDFFQNPDEAFQQRLSPMEERFDRMERSLRLRASRAEAIASHGREAVIEMEQAIEKASREGHPEIAALGDRMRNSDNPVEIAMNWHKQTKLMEATGGDVTAYRAKLSDELLNDPEFLAKALEAARAKAGQPSAPRPQVKLPPSISRTPGSGATERSDQAEDMTDAALYAHATARGGR